MVSISVAARPSTFAETQQIHHPTTTVRPDLPDNSSSSSPCASNDEENSHPLACAKSGPGAKTAPTFPHQHRRENNRTSLACSPRAPPAVGHGPSKSVVCVIGNALRHVGYDSASSVLVIVVVKCCCCSAVVAPKCPPPPPYMFMFRSRRATLTKRLTKAARKRRPPGGGADDCAASAHHLDNLLRQLQENQLEMLLRAVEHGGGDCVLVRKERTPPSPQHPHLLCCQTWRWPEVRQASELKRLPSCRSASDPVYVCCNPYHWSRLCLPGMCKECMLYVIAECILKNDFGTVNGFKRNPSV